MKIIKLMPDYQCYPLWKTGDDAGDINPNDFLISNKLKEDLFKWQSTYDQTLNMSNPAESGFHNEEAYLLFKKEGKFLQDRLQKELGSEYKVLYFYD